MTRANFMMRGARVALRSIRAPLLVLAALLVGACGREAPPRAINPTSAPATRAPTPALSLAQAAETTGTAAPQHDDPRAQGEPNAPITVIEYGDYQ